MSEIPVHGRASAADGDVSLFIGSFAKLQAVEPVRRISLAQPMSTVQQVEENVTNVGTSGAGALTEEGLPSRALRLCRRGHRSARGQGDNELLSYAEPSCPGRKMTSAQKSARQLE